MRSVRGFVLGAAIVLSAGAARADLITNGSFEQPSVTSGYSFYTNGGVPGWTSNNNEIEIGTSSFYGISNYAGTQLAELNGSMYDTISQTVTGLTAGAKYTLTWAYAGRSGAGSQRMDVSWGGTRVATNLAADGTAWTTNSMLVTATSSSMVLSFAGVNTGAGAGPNYGNLLDGVTLNAAAVPEPATIALLMAGVAAVAAVRMRRRA